MTTLTKNFQGDILSPQENGLFFKDIICFFSFKMDSIILDPALNQCFGSA